MGIVRATAVIAHADGVPNDSNINVWHFTAAAPETTFVADLASATNGGIAGFYQRLDGYFGRDCNAGTDIHRIDYALVTPGAAGAGDDVVSALIAEEVFTLTPETTGTPMPNEVAVCMSFNGAVAGVPVESGSTRPRSRRTGRLYIGFLDHTQAAAYGEADLNTRPKAAFRDAILDSAEALNDDVLEASGVWVVYSRAAATTHPIINVWVDNAFDTQRRRGPEATTRENRAL